MFKKYLVPVPQISGKIYKKKTKLKDGAVVIYIEYELERIYSSKRKNTSTRRTTIGRLCPENKEMMYPNDNYYKYISDAEYPDSFQESSRSGCLKTGSYVVIKKIVQDYKLDELLNISIGEKNTGLFLDLCGYTINCENNAAQYYPDYAYNHPLFTTNMHVYSDSTVSNFLNDLTKEQQLKFLELWTNRTGKQDKIYISYDSTNKVSEAGDLEIVELGESKTGKETTIFNYSLIFDHNNREPLLYEKYLGSINDVAQLEFLLKKIYGYGYRNICIILDRGYFSKPNIHYMDRHGISFIMMVKGNKQLVSKLILEHKHTFENKYECHIGKFDVNGKTVESKLYETDEHVRYFHLFYSPDKYASEREKLMKKTEAMEEAIKEAQGTAQIFPNEFHHYFELYYKEETKKIKKGGKEEEIKENILQTYTPKTKVIDDETETCGYFAIITSDPMTAEEAYLRYKGRDPIEKLFRGDKSYLGNKTARVYSDESTEAKIFIEFVALIIRNKIYTTLFDEAARTGSKQNFMTVPAAIKELNKIELIRTPDGIYRMDHAITATQKTILKAFGLTAQDVKTEAEQIGRQVAVYDSRENEKKPEIIDQ